MIIGAIGIAGTAARARERERGTLALVISACTCPPRRESFPTGTAALGRGLVRTV
jgi:hypothetical protein